MITVGVDLAAEPKTTAIALIDWASKSAVVRELTVGADDRQVVQAVTAAEKAGIDCPLGWPAPFVAFISGHHDGHVIVPDGVSGREWRRRHAYRATDDAVRMSTGLAR